MVLFQFVQNIKALMYLSRMKMFSIGQRLVMMHLIRQNFVCGERTKKIIGRLNNLKILVWVPVLTQYTDDGRILECVYKTLAENNIEIPFPQRDLHIIHGS